MRFYRLLLHLYPASFRNEYGEQMSLIFDQRRRAASGTAAAVLLWIESLLEIGSNAIMVHWDLLRQDMRYAARMLRRSPGFALTAVLIVALGIGATTAAFSVTDFVLLRPLPFPDPSRLVSVWEHTPGYNRMELSPANYRDWKGESKSFERIGAYVNMPVNMTGKEEPLRLERAAVDADLFPVLGVQPLTGRNFTAEDDHVGAPGTAILSYQLWQAQFGGQDVVGQKITLDNEPYTVVGVMPREFRFPDSETALWTSMRLPNEAYQDRNDNWLYAVGRLRPGMTLQQARAEWNLLAAQTERQFPKELEHTSTNLILLSDYLSLRSRLLLEALCGAAACMLLIACANLANLLLARALGRRREIAVRTALGAGRERLIRQLITESLLLALVGGTIGVSIANMAVPLLTRLVPNSLPIAAGPSIDLRILVFAAVLTVVTGVVFGLAPVARLGYGERLTALHEESRAGGGRKERLRSALVVAEIIASVVLLVSAGLLMRALWNVEATDPGFKAAGVLTLQTALPQPQYEKTDTRVAFYDRVLGEVRALPGVAHAAYVSSVPMVWRGGIWPIEVPGQPATRAENRTASLRYVTPDYFATLNIPIKSGRDVSEADTRERPYAAVVSQSFVRRYWPNEDPLGRHFKFALHDRMIVGVVGDIRVRGLEEASEPQVYIPYRQVEDRNIIGYIPKDLVVRSSGTPTALLPAIRGIVRRADPNLPVSDVRTLTDIVARETASRSVQLRVIGAFAVMAFLLAAIGIHGVLAFSVAPRTQEFGIRMALGAQPGDILNMVVRQGVQLACAGVIPGIALAYAAGRTMQALLVGVKPGDVETFAAVAGLAVAMTAAGTLVPTVRALKVDPMLAIRSE